jgi:hypothetical protein
MRYGLLALLVMAGCAHSASAPANPATTPKLVTAEFQMTEAHLVLAEIARQADASLVYHGSWETFVTVTLRGASWRDAVQAVADSCDLDVNWETPGIVRVTPRGGH